MCTKKEGKDREENYKPILILPTFSKVMETIIPGKLVSYFDNENIFAPAQYGYTSGRSTVTAMLDTLILIKY